MLATGHYGAGTHTEPQWLQQEQQQGDGLPAVTAMSLHGKLTLDSKKQKGQLEDFLAHQV